MLPIDCRQVAILLYGIWSYNIEMKEKVPLSIALILILLLSCTANNDCYTADSVKQIKSFDINSHAYFIYIRNSGFHQKEVFFELYDNVPVFDDCGKPDIPIVSAVHVDSTQGTVSKLVINANNLKIVYKKNPIENISFDNIPIEIKRR